MSTTDGRLPTDWANLLGNITPEEREQLLAKLNSLGPSSAADEQNVELECTIAHGVGFRNLIALLKQFTPTISLLFSDRGISHESVSLPDGIVYIIFLIPWHTLLTYKLPGGVGEVAFTCEAKNLEQCLKSLKVSNTLTIQKIEDNFFLPTGDDRGQYIANQRYTPPADIAIPSYTSPRVVVGMGDFEAMCASLSSTKGSNVVIKLYERGISFTSSQAGGLNGGFTTFGDVDTSPLSKYESDGSIPGSLLKKLTKIRTLCRHGFVQLYHGLSMALRLSFPVDGCGCMIDIYININLNVGSAHGA